MTTPTNLDLVRSILAAWERGDFSSAEWADPEIEFASADGPDPGRWLGRGEMADHWRGQLSPWENLHVAVEEYRELDGERVLVLIHSRGRGKASGVGLEQMQANGAVLLHVHGGNVTRLVLYWDRERAFADLGLAD